MNLSVKRCLLGLVAWATMFGIARAQFNEPAGTVQIGPPAINGGQALPQGPSSITDYGAQPLPSGAGTLYGMSSVDRVFAPRVNIDSRGGGLYGYQNGYTNIGIFAPHKIEENAIVFVHGMGLITYDGRGGATVGTGWRYWMEGLDRIVGLSAWFDFDNGHAQPYQQVGLSFESLGRYVDYRVNGYIPISNPDHVLYSQLTTNSVLYGSGIGLIRNNTVEQSYTGFDAETGGPVPLLGRYGLNAYIGGYYFTGNGQKGGDFTGVSGRLLSQINEDVSFGVQVTDDHVFGLNTQFQVFVNLPNGKPGRWFRNPRVHDRLVQNVFRQNRVMAKTSSYTTTDIAIDPNTHRPYFVANINPNLATGGNGQANSPFNSIAQYEAIPLAQRQQYDVILVAPRTDASNTNLDTTKTLDLFSGQHLLSTSMAHTFMTSNLPGQTLTMPGYTGGSAPKLYNSSGMDVITLAGGNTLGMEVSGFQITGSASGNGIAGKNNFAVNINNNEILSGLNGVALTNLSGKFTSGIYPTGSIPPGSEAMFINNNIHDNVSDGINVTNHGSPPFVNPLEVLVQGNTFSKNGNSGLKLNAEAGASIGGLIGGANTPATSTTPVVVNANTFSGNSQNGLELDANGGTLTFQTPVPSTPTPVIPTGMTLVTPPTFGIINNVFTANTFDGLHIYTTNNSVSTFNVANNQFGLASTTVNNSATGNKQYGIGLISDSGNTEITIGGALITNGDGSITNPGNTFNFNAVNAINLAASGTAVLNYDISNNLISNSASVSIPAPHDAFSFSFNGVSGTAPFSITNNSDPGVNITSVVWNLAGTPATIAATNQGLLGTINPVVLQSINDTLLTSLNGRTVIAGSAPLIMSVLNKPATNANSGLAANTQLIPMGFTGFAPTDVFNATARFEQNGGSTPLSSAATNSSVLTVTFSNGLTAIGKVNQPLASSVAVEASGSVFGSSTPGTGNGNDGIHVIASGNATLGNSTSSRSSIIDGNTVTGYGGFGIHVETAGNATASNIVIQNNKLSSNGSGVVDGTPAFTGGGVEIARSDSSTLNAILASNTITSNFNYGVVLSSDGTATGGLNVYSHDNTITNNANNGLELRTSGNAGFTFATNRDTFSGNGSASGKNASTTGGDNISIVTSGTSVTNITLNNIISNGTSGTGLNSNGLATGSGLSATTNDASTLNLLIQTLPDPTFTGMSSFSNNKVNGIVLNSNGTSYMHASIYDTLMNSNGENGILFNRTTASLVRANIVDSFMQGNAVNGLRFYGLGSDPQDPNQQFTGTPNRINLIGDSLNNNGLNGVGQGARIDLCGDSLLVLNANNTTFDSNAQNGLRISLAPGASFGYELGNERSTLDNVQINDNGSNGIFVTSTITPTDATTNNPILPYDAPSITFMQVSANTGSTEINHNGFGINPTGLSGILMQYLGGNHDVLIEGDVAHATPIYSTVIQGNAGDGIQMQSGIEAVATVSVDRVLIGGPNPTDANGGNGINFEAISRLVIVDGALSKTWLFNGAGIATLNVNESTIQGNKLNGIFLLGNGFSDNSTGSDGTGNFTGDPYGLLNASITNSNILNNGQTGINILLEGNFGYWREPGSGGFTTGTNATFNISNNVIDNNGDLGVRMELNAGYAHTNWATDFFDTRAGSNPPLPFNPDDPQYTPGTNEGFASPIRDVALLSNFLWLSTQDNASLNLFNNTIQFNGTNKNLRAADGVFIRVSTESYLAADIQGNTISGNVANDLHIESFVQYNPTNGLAYQPIPSVRRSPPALSTVYWDYTAQMDLRLIGNKGNMVNIQDPTVNYLFNGIYQPLQGNSTPNGAVLGGRNAANDDPLKDNFGAPGYANPTPRLVQLFQIDNGAGLDPSNNFQQNGITQNLFNAFYNADFNLRGSADPFFPNPAFPQDYIQNIGNPFLP